MLKPGLVSVTFRALSIAQIVDLAVQTGLEGIEWGGDVHVPPGDPDSANLAAQLSRGQNLAVVSYGSYYRLGQTDADEFNDVISSCLMLGAPNIRVWAGDRASIEADSAYRQRIAADALRCARQAERAGVNLSLEFHPGTLTDTAESALDLISTVGANNLFTYWQVSPEKSHMENLADMRLLNGRVSNIHCHSHRDGKIGPLVNGQTQWPSYLRTADRDDKERWVLIEFVADHAPDALAADVQVLKKWLAKLPGK
jgi:sugar phosphate isomerase/epimerase